MDSRPAGTLIPLRSVREFGLHELTAPRGLRIQLLPSGAVHAIRHRRTLLNQVLPGPAEDGLSRLLLRWREAPGLAAGWAPLAGPGLSFSTDPHAATWRTTTAGGIACTTTLGLHPRFPAWAWRVHLRNEGPTPLTLDVLHAQDLGLADEGAVRNNEAYVSQYLDLLPLTDTRLGAVILARQNQPMAGGRHPWLAVGCASGATAYCTDGSQFFGPDHRLTGEPAAVRAPSLPSRRLQRELALAGLQSHPLRLEPGATAEIVFVARFRPHHPAASGPADLTMLEDLLPVDWLAPATTTPASHAPGSVFHQASWLHGVAPTAADWDVWFPGERRHLETAADGSLLSFFHGAGTHVVSRDKEAAVARPHGHILRSGAATWIDDHQFGLTCYAAGIFGAQAYLGNSSLARLLSVVRNPLNLARASGQRVFVRHDSAWSQLGIPSAFALEPGVVRWIYRLDDGVIELRAWCSAQLPASMLELRVSAGPAREFLITHQLTLGAQEFDHGGELERQADGWIAARPAAESLMGRHLPGHRFALAAADPDQLAAHGGDELIYADGVARHGPYAAFRTRAINHGGLLLLGVLDGPAALPGAVARARLEFKTAAPPARFPAAPVRLAGSRDPATARLDDILPWFTHNAAIHFSAPHGLEQSSGAAWGVRDVCQGSVEWLLAAGEFATVRRILTTVFAQQYAHRRKERAVAGSWPQWFMFAPFRFIQQNHSHGDVCFWPVKALCDYVEASNDLAFLEAKLGYTDPRHFTTVPPLETVWAHCDRVIDHCESRFIGDTALVNYGDGDWDDTLQPADPAMRTRMLSVWTVALAFQTFHQLAGVSRQAGQTARTTRLEALLGRMRADFARHALPGGVTAGFLIAEADGSFRPLLHPSDQRTGIRYRLLPMTRSILAGLFTPDEAVRHATLIEEELRFADGVRLMSEPAVYRGGLEHLFKRADTAANVGREIGLQYVHAHLRYAEAMARLGDAGRLWWALQVVNPVALAEIVPGALPRQANVYFSSSDADFADRLEATDRWPDLRAGLVPVHGGWRLYSSGPGLFLRQVRSSLLGVRESFGNVIFDPVLPASLHGLTANVTVRGRPAQLRFTVTDRVAGVRRIAVNGHALAGLAREPNPYRPGGLIVPGATLAALLAPAINTIDLDL